MTIVSEKRGVSVGKKIKIILLLGGCLSLLQACGKPEKMEEDQPYETIIEETQTTIEYEETQYAMENDIVEVETYLQANEEQMSVAQTFQAVLRNEKKFIGTDKDQYAWLEVVRDFEGFLKDIPYGYENRNSVVQFSIVDMDGDMIPEVVLELENYYGYIILRYRDGQVYGNVVGIRSMNLLNAQGTFMFSSGADNGGIGKFYFIKDTMVCNEAIRMENIDSYYIHDIISNREIWNNKNDLFDASQKVEWYEFTEEQIASKFEDNPLFEEPSPERLENSRERQRYIDSLYYLIELTFDTSKKAKSEYKEDARVYFNSCMQEMNKIYQLCQDKMTGEELAALQEEQQLWMDNFEKRANIDLEVYKFDNLEELLDNDSGYVYYGYVYYEYVDIILRRVLALVDLYYGCHFYDTLF